MKKLIVTIASIAVLGVASIASAATYSFDHMIDNWGPFGLMGAVPIVEGSPLNYSHDINGLVNFAAGDRVTNATLELDFTNDSSDAVTSFLGRILWDKREFSQVGFDGTSWVDLGEVDNGVYSLILDIDWLNDDGILDVTISASNPGWNPATAWLDHSRLFGTAETAPVPEPGTIVLLGAGLLGLGLFGKRRMKKA